MTKGTGRSFHRVRPLVKLLECLLIFAMGLLVLDVLWGVLSRVLGGFKAWLHSSAGMSLAFLPDGQSPWTEELARFLLIWTSLLGAALGFERRAHLGVDYFMEKFHPHARQWLNIVSHLLVMVFACFVLVYGGWLLMETTMDSAQTTPALGLRKWTVYSVIPLSGLFVILFTAQNLLADLQNHEVREGEVQ